MDESSRLLRAALLALLAAPVAASAVDVPLTFVNVGTAGSTAVFRADLSALAGLSMNAITITDDGTPVGGSSGVFSGVDVDAIFLDADGNISTTGDRTFASSFNFTAGTTRPTSDPLLQPTAAHPGPTFGSLSASTIDAATATLNAFDSVDAANVNVANGFLTLGDGGVLKANFAPPVNVPSALFILTGDVGGQSGEGLGANATASTVGVPDGGSTGLLLGMALAGVAGARRRFTRS